MNDNDVMDLLLTAYWSSIDACDTIGLIVSKVEQLQKAGDELALHINKICFCANLNGDKINEKCEPCSSFLKWKEVRSG
jgi:hypothetical protein